MPRPKRSERLLAKAEAAFIAAIEVYNKPNSLYREETFSILVLNSWELLLKAKLVDACKGDTKCLFQYEYRYKKDGSRSSRRYLRKNRAGGMLTLGMFEVIRELEGTQKIQVGSAVKNNLEALVQVRDNAVHYFNASPELAKRVLEFGTASVTNFVALANRWFNLDLSSYNFHLMPIGFVSIPTNSKGVVLTPDENNLLHYLASLIQDTEIDESEGLHLSLGIDLSFTRSQSPGAIPVFKSNDPDAIKVQLSEEDIRKQFPWDYDELKRRVKERYSDVKLNKDFLNIRKPLMIQSQYVHSRFLDPGNPKSSKKDFYSPAILNEFDKHYTRSRTRSSA